MVDIYLRAGHATPEDIKLWGASELAAKFKIKGTAGIYYLHIVGLGDGQAGMGGIPRKRIDGVTYDILLVELADPLASPMRIRTTTATKAVKYYKLVP